MEKEKILAGVEYLIKIVTNIEKWKLSGCITEVKINFDF